MAALLYRLGAWTYRRRRIVLVAWLAILVAVGALAGTAGGSYEDDFSIPGSQAQRVLDTVAEQFPASSGASAQVVFVAAGGRGVAEYGGVIEQTLAAAEVAPGVVGVMDPVTSADGRVAMANVAFREKRVAGGELDALEDVFRPAREAGLRVEFGGAAYRDSSEESGLGAEAAGLLIAVGGDDYLTKPFDVAEVAARLAALLRRARHVPPSAPDGVLRCGDLEMDEARHVVTRGGRPVELSPTEFRLLRYLLANTGMVVSKAQILDHVWQYDFGGDAGVVERFVSNLRRKIDFGGPSLIHTVRGFGYSLRPVAR